MLHIALDYLLVICLIEYLWLLCGGCCAQLLSASSIPAQLMHRSADRDGGRKERALKKQADDRAAAVSPRLDSEAADDADDEQWL